MSTTLFGRLCSYQHLFRAWEHVKRKNSRGGIDGATISEFDASLEENLRDLLEELKTGRWTPEPYFRIEIPKNANEKRQLGLLTVRDKIVQQAIRMLVEPRCERLFLNNSYGYRPGKGAVKAIRRAFSECQGQGKEWILKLDIDNFFDNVDHEILESRVSAVVNDPEILRLIMLCVKMGVVSKSMRWNDSVKGLPQGAVLSPMLANLYLHSFDQYITSRTTSYVRYADDFVILVSSEFEVSEIRKGAEEYLSQRLRLPLNSPLAAPLSTGADFLGITIKKDSYSVSESKMTEILSEIGSFRLSLAGLDAASSKRWSGISAYYGELLKEEELVRIDSAFFSSIKESVRTNWHDFRNQSILREALSGLVFLSSEFSMKEQDLKKQLVEVYLQEKRVGSMEESGLEIRKAVNRRKREYIKKEAENSELLVASRGVTLGLTKKGITVKSKGVIVKTCPVSNLKHVTIMSEGVGISSNLLLYLMSHKIPLDFFMLDGGHVGSFISSSSFQCMLWSNQANASVARRNLLAASIIEGKLTNQLNLIKYYHKYHKSVLPDLEDKMNELENLLDAHKAYVKTEDPNGEKYIGTVASDEAQGAVKYWECVRCLLSNDDVQFDNREHKGAKDLVNCMLNYGYAILYARCWQALLYAQLNPYDSVLHARQAGKPTFVFDFVELFRAQAVDRVVISLVQKNEPLHAEDGKLSDETRRLLAKNITERLYKKEKFRNESMTLDRIIKVQAKEIAAYFEREIKFRPYKAKW